MSARGPFACPACGSDNDAATQVAGDPVAAPSPGDLMVCIDCAAPAVMGPDGALQLAPPEVLVDSDLRRAVQAVKLSLLFRDGRR